MSTTSSVERALNGIRVTSSFRERFYVSKYGGGELVPSDRAERELSDWALVAKIKGSRTTPRLPGGLVVFQNEIPIFGLSVGDVFRGSPVERVTDARVVTKEMTFPILHVVRDPSVTSKLTFPERQTRPEPPGVIAQLDGAVSGVTDEFKAIVRSTLENGTPFTLGAVREVGAATVDCVDLVSRTACDEIWGVQFLMLVVDGQLRTCDIHADPSIDTTFDQGGTFPVVSRYTHIGGGEFERVIGGARLVEVSRSSIRFEMEDGSVSKKRPRTDVVSAAATIVSHVRKVREVEADIAKERLEKELLEPFTNKQRELLCKAACNDDDVLKACVLALHNLLEDDADATEESQRDAVFEAEKIAADIKWPETAGGPARLDF